MLAALYMFGSQVVMPVPDLERTPYWLIMGGNPVVSNGSLMSAPNVRQRLKDLAFIDRMAHKYTGKAYERRTAREVFEVAIDRVSRSWAR